MGLVAALAIFSSALCYWTAELLSSVVRPSVNPFFSETVKQINAKFDGKVPFHHISRLFFFFFQNFAFLIFYDFFSVLLTWDHMAEKIQTTSPLKVHITCTPQKSCILLGRVSTVASLVARACAVV